MQSPGGPCINSVYKPEQRVSISSPKLVFIEEKHAAEMCRPPAYFKPRTCTHTFGRKSTKTFLHLTLKPQNQHGYRCTTNIETSKYSGQSQWLMLCIFYIQSVVDASAKSKSLSIDFGLAQKRFWFSIETTDLFDPFKALNLPYLWRGTDGCTAACQLGFTLDNSTH